MISREEMHMLVAGAANQAGLGVEQVSGRRLTRSELEAIGEVFATFGRLVADRVYSSTKTPPPPPFRERRPATFFDPLATQRIKPIPKDVGDK